MSRIRPRTLELELVSTGRSISDIGRLFRPRILGPVGLVLLVGALVFVTPAAAAPTPTPTAAADSEGNPVCSTENLPGMVEGFFQITTTVGILGFAVVLQIDTLIEIFNPPPETRQKLKRHKLAAAKSAGLLTLIGPLYAVAGPLMGLPLAPCLNLVPW